MKESDMSRWKRKTETTAKSVSEEEIDIAKGIQIIHEPDSAADDITKQRSFRGIDLIMKLSCCNNGKTKSSLLKSSDTIYSLLCATYLTYSTNKEKLTSGTEILKEITHEHNRLEQNIKEKREILRNFKLQQKRMKNEKIWFKTKTAEYNEQSTLLQDREMKLQVKKDTLKEEFQRDKTKLDQLADELGTYLNFKAIQYSNEQNRPASENESQDENDLKALLTDVTDSDVALNATQKEQSEPVNESEQPVNGSEPVKHLPPKSQRSKSIPKSKPRVKQKMPEATIQSLICEDLLILEGASDDDGLFSPMPTPTKKRDRDNKMPKPTTSGVTIISTSESMVSWCQCKNNLQNALNSKAKE